MRNRTTQRQRILQLLREREGGWVPSPELAAIALQYNARVLELRRQGYNIENKAQHVNGQVHGAFRLVLPKEQGQLFPQQRIEKGGHWLEVLGQRI